MSWYLLYIIIDDEIIEIIYRRFFYGNFKIYGERTETNSP